MLLLKFAAVQSIIYGISGFFDCGLRNRLQCFCYCVVFAEFASGLQTLEEGEVGGCLLDVTVLRWSRLWVKK